MAQFVFPLVLLFQASASAIVRRSDIAAVVECWALPSFMSATPPERGEDCIDAADGERISDSP